MLMLATSSSYYIASVHVYRRCRGVWHVVGVTAWIVLGSGMTVHALILVGSSLFAH